MSMEFNKQIWKLFKLNTGNYVFNDTNEKFN